MKYLLSDMYNLDNSELIEYNKIMQKRKDELLQEATLWTNEFRQLRSELKHRLEELEFDMLVAEEDRQLSDDVIHDAMTRLH